MTRIYIIVINLLLTFSSFGQGLIERYPEIQKGKARIDQNDSLSTIKLENEEFLENKTDGGVQLKGLYDQNANIRKIEVSIYKSHGVQEYDFYLVNEIPFLIEDRFKQFAWNEESNTIDQSSFDGGFYGTYIFQDSQLIDHISLGHNRFEDDTIDIEETYLTELKDYIKKIKKRLANNK